jgi:hypothetical protein
VTITPGWLRTALERHVELSKDRYSDLMHVQDAADADPDSDTSPFGAVAATHAASGETIYTPRGQVRHDADDRRFADQARLDEATQITANILKQPPDEVFGSVSVPPPAGRGPTGDGLTAFLSYLVPTQERGPRAFPPQCFEQEDLEDPADIKLAIPSCVATPGKIPGITITVAELSVEYGQRFLMGSHRLDLGSSIRLADVGLVSKTVLLEPAVDGEAPMTNDDGVAIP